MNSTEPIEPFFKLTLQNPVNIIRLKALVDYWDQEMKLIAERETKYRLIQQEVDQKRIADKKIKTASMIDQEIPDNMPHPYLEPHN